MGKKRKAAADSAQAANPPPAAPVVAIAAAGSRAAHSHTDLAPSGLGQKLATAPGRLAKGPLQELCTSFPAAKWAPPAVARSTCPHSAAAAVELELARAASLEQLRSKLSSLCAKAGLRNVPLLSFERWRFAAKWAEDEPQMASSVLETARGGGAGGSGQPSGAAGAAAGAAVPPAGSKEGRPGSKAQGGGVDPVLPYGGLPAAVEPGLFSDLRRAGLAAEAASSIAQQIGEASAEACVRLARRRHQLASGKPPACPPLQLAFRRHSLEFTCGGRFVRVSPAFYGKLARLYRSHWLEAPGAPAGAAAAGASLGLPMDAAAAMLAELDPAGGPAGGGSGGGREGDGASGSEEDVPGGGASSEAAGAGGDAALCAEARIAELEAAAAATAGASAEGGSDSGGGGARGEFHRRLFALLLRYKSLQGAGFQAAAGPPVFKLLRERLAVGFECFASPLNAAFARFGSAFPDVDGPFGSAGSFFKLQLKHGSYEVNPPFVPALLTAAAQHMLALLQAAEAAGGALSFAVLMPGWQEVAGWQLLQASPFLRHSLLVAAADHGYCDGSSHQARDLYRQSPYDTALLVLQTSGAAARWRVTPPLAQQLHAALAACCPSAAAAERQRKQRGQGDLEWRGLGAPVQKAPAAAAAGEMLAGGAADEGQQKQQSKKKQKRKPAAGDQPAGAQQQQQPLQQQPKKKRQKQKHAAGGQPVGTQQQQQPQEPNKKQKRKPAEEPAGTQQDQQQQGQQPKKKKHKVKKPSGA